MVRYGIESGMLVVDGGGVGWWNWWSMVVLVDWWSFEV